ncbi:MAG: hypothetical protein ACT4O0_18540 [Pseudonocardia sp.]|jgi:hypothetical protein
MLALVAAVVFLVSLIFKLANLDLGVIDVEFLNILGFLIVALYLAGIGGRTWRR